MGFADTDLFLQLINFRIDKVRRIDTSYVSEQWVYWSMYGLWNLGGWVARLFQEAQKQPILQGPEDLQKQ